MDQRSARAASLARWVELMSRSATVASSASAPARGYRRREATLAQVGPRTASTAAGRR